MTTSCIERAAVVIADTRFPKMQDSKLRWDDVIDQSICDLQDWGFPNSKRTKKQRLLVMQAVRRLRAIGSYIQDQVDGGYDGLLPLDHILGECDEK